MADKRKGIAIVGFDGMMDFMDESLRQGRAARCLPTSRWAAWAAAVLAAAIALFRWKIVER